MEVKISNFILKPELFGVLDEAGDFIDFFKKLSFNSKIVSVNGVKLTPLEKRKFLNHIEIIDRKISPEFLYFDVYQYMRHHIINRFLQLKDYQKKIKDSLNIVGLKSLNLNKRIIDLSSCEKKLLQFATSLLSNPDMIILDSFLEVFDMRLRKKIENLLIQLVEKYQKIVILCSNQSTIIYQYTKQTIIIKKQKKLLEGPTYEVFSKNIKFLLEEGIEVPEILLFTYQANLLKNAKLNYHKDSRDLIKDIYKKV